MRAVPRPAESERNNNSLGDRSKQKASRKSLKELGVSIECVKGVDR